MNTKFNKTSIYIQFGEVLNVDLNQLSKDDLEFYTNELVNLKSNIPCNKIPTNNQIIKYLLSDEYIDPIDTNDFIFFVKQIFTKYYSVINHITLKLV